MNPKVKDKQTKTSREAGNSKPKKRWMEALAAPQGAAALAGVATARRVPCLDSEQDYGNRLRWMSDVPRTLGPRGFYQRFNL